MQYAHYNALSILNPLQCFSSYFVSSLCTILFVRPPFTFQNALHLACSALHACSNPYGNITLFATSFLLCYPIFYTLLCSYRPAMPLFTCPRLSFRLCYLDIQLANQHPRCHPIAFPLSPPSLCRPIQPLP